MAKKPGKTHGVPRKAGPKDVPVKTDSAALEEQTIARVERTIRTLEEFLSRWDSAVTKPDSMFPEVVKIRKFHDLLIDWRDDALSARGKGDEKSRVKRLRDFVVLCKMYS